MATEGAGGLSTANLAAVLDALDDDEPIGLWQFEAAARAELAALRAAAERASALAAALTEARGYLGSLDGRELVGAGRALRLDARALLRRLDAALADAGPGAAGAQDDPRGYRAARGAAPWQPGMPTPGEAIRRGREGGAAGARDETAALRDLEAAVRCQVGHRDRNECGKVDVALAALDALRAARAT